MNCLCYDEKYSGETRLIKQTRTRETDLFAATAILSTLRFPILLRSLPFFLSFLPSFFLSPFLFSSAFSRRDQRRMDRGRSMSKARRRRRGGIFIVNVKRARRMTPATSYSVLLSNPLDGIIRHFLQAASHSTDIKIQLLLEKKGRIPNGVSPIWSGQRLDDFQVEEEEDATRILLLFSRLFFFFFFIFFPPPNQFRENRDDR